MKRVLCILISLIFLSGCALTTIKPAKRSKKKPWPVKKTVIQKVKEAFKPQPEPKPEPIPVVVEEEKEEVLPLEEEDIK